MSNIESYSDYFSKLENCLESGSIEEIKNQLKLLFNGGDKPSFLRDNVCYSDVLIRLLLKMKSQDDILSKMAEALSQLIIEAYAERNKQLFDKVKLFDGFISNFRKRGLKK